jgi:hypothetical protein
MEVVGETDDGKRTAVASLAAVAALCLIIAVRGTSDWSKALVVAWWVTLLFATATGIAAFVFAVRSHRPGYYRAIVALMSLPGVLSVPIFFAWLVIALPGR